MEKYIHYCWFGGKPLPKLAKKCLKSWQKYLPDFEIIEWNENNFDVNVTKFSACAYKEKKWAFVSDVARTYALKEYGGIYFDTDMLLTKNIDFLMDVDAFAGWESEFYVNAAVLGAKKGSKLINDLWQFYENNEFDAANTSSMSIPLILTNLLKSDYNLVSNHKITQDLKNNVKIYSRDYFYPISCDDTPNDFSPNTCMVHYYIASWVPNKDKRRLKFQMKFGKVWGDRILNFLVFIKKIIKTILKIILYPLVLYRRKRIKNRLYLEARNEFLEQIENSKKSNYLVIYNKNWLGTKNSVKELFDNLIGIEEIWDERLVLDIASKIVEKKYKMVIFSAFAYGWDDLAKKIKELNKNIKIKVIWHGSNAMNVEYYDWESFKTIFDLLNESYIDSIALVKKSMYEYYHSKGYKVEFLANTVSINEKFDVKKNNDRLRIGIYASGDRWVKNMYNQLAAASMFKDAVIDSIPLTYKALRMANLFKANLVGLFTSVEREELLKRIAQNDINFYVTFTECAPLIPLESLELGVPCITSDNHHYWEGTELEKYLVVSKNDNIISIYEKAKYALENKETILKLYQEWKKDYDKKVKKNVEEFLK